MRLQFFVPGILVNPTNQRWHWTKRRAWAKQWREAGAFLCRVTRGLHHPMWDPKSINFHCRVRRMFDTDNLAACCKPLRDGIADELGVSDGPKGGIVWTYTQIVDRKAPGVLVTVE